MKSTYLDKRSVILLLIQVVIVSSIAAKYLYQRNTCPRVWTRAEAFDPELVLRGRYLSTQLRIDACGVALTIANDRNYNPSDSRVSFKTGINQDITDLLPVLVEAKAGKLVVARIADSNRESNSQELTLQKGAACTEASLWSPVDFYTPEQAQSPFPLAKGQYLWVEVTVPPKGPPRPLSLAINNNGQWKPLSF